ncbi:MAG: hypothetical protein ACE5D3_00675 [Candidatus Binatia bacterium]
MTDLRYRHRDDIQRTQGAAGDDSSAQGGGLLDRARSLHEEHGAVIDRVMSQDSRRYNRESAQAEGQ